METLLLALGLVLVVEGLVYVLAPSIVEDLLDALRRLPVPARRHIGAIVLVTGLLFIWIARNLGA